MTNDPSSTSSHETNLDAEAVRLIGEAARVGREVYPGPVGELIDRELRAYAETGYRVPDHSLTERLVATLLEQKDREPVNANPERSLPARYIKGTPLHWELTPRAELPRPAEESRRES
jgi:hypothetical protein